MRPIIIFILIVAGLDVALAQSKTFNPDFNHRYFSAKGTPKLLGLTNREGLLQKPFNEWFATGYNEYDVDMGIVNRLKTQVEDLTMKIFLGTWCPDSQREVPRYFKILDELGIKDENVIMVSLDYEADDYKQSPGHEETGMQIHRVPTFIVMRHGKELSRIVEFPKETLEQDLMKIIDEGNYQSRYPVVSDLQILLEKKSLKTLNSQLDRLVNKYAHIIENKWALDSYGRVLFHSGRIQESIFVLELQQKLFPNEVRSYTNSAKVYYAIGRDKVANKMIEQALKIDSTDQNANQLKQKHFD